MCILNELDIHCVNSATFSATFALHGLPEFVSSELKSFLHKNGINHITSPPYQPTSNGLIEQAMQTFKQGLKKQGDGTVETK